MLAMAAASATRVATLPRPACAALAATIIAAATTITFHPRAPHPSTATHPASPGGGRPGNRVRIQRRVIAKLL
jgi:hypothetical protein